MRARTLVDLQIAVLAAGTLFAWSIVATDLYRFTLTGGDLTQFRGTALPNPLITACFYGGIIFAVALSWAFRLQQHGPDARGERRLGWLLLAGAVFALGNLGYECYMFYGAVDPGARSLCTGRAIISPFTTPCFVGSLFYVAALATTVAVRRSLRRLGSARPSAPRELPAHDRVA